MGALKGRETWTRAVCEDWSRFSPYRMARSGPIRVGKFPGLTLVMLYWPLRATDWKCFFGRFGPRRVSSPNTPYALFLL
jgi:hypothetical protein